MSLVQTALGSLPLLWSAVLFCATVPVLVALRRWFRVFVMAQRLPTPKAHPILGHAADFASKERFFDRAMNWCKEFPVFHKTQILFHPLILVHSPEAVQTILSRQKHSEKGFIYKGLKALLGEGLITSKGSRWHSHRKLITPTFHFNILESFLDVFVNRSKELMQRLKEKEGENCFDISPYTQRLTLDFICETAMGTPIDAQGNERLEIVSAIHKLEEIGIYRMIRPWLLSDLIFKFTQKGREQVKYKNILHNFTDKVIKERKEALRLQALDANNNKLEVLKEGEESDFGRKKRAIFMDLLIESSQNGTLLSDADIREEVNTFMFAGQNTTQLAINYCLYLLGNDLEIQEQVYEELEGIFQGSDRDPTMDDLREMHLLERCIKEALRLFPSVPVIARTLTEDQPMGKHILPKGADVLILPYVLHRNPEQFPDPEKFNPDHFLTENIKKRHAFSYIPFSAGPRNCIGQKFAMLAEKTILSTILRRYIVKSADPRDKLVVVPNTVLVPKRGIKISLSPR